MLCEIMEIKEEQQLMVDAATHIIAKGKRTKRTMRLLSSPCGGATSSSVNSGDSSSTTTYESADQEDEDMANCLILLAQGGGGGEDSHHHHHHQKQHVDHDGNDHNKTEEKGSRKFAEIATASNSNTKVGFFIYECKTCNRTFPSFQALGGHRASHKKPKLMMPEEKKPTPTQPQSQPQPQQRSIIANYDRIEEPHMKTTGPPISLQLDRAFHGVNKTTKIHECSICGSEFTSGQALGGHMRRHRATAATVVPAVQVEVQPRNVLELDLNLPAPEEDLRESNFQFTATQKSMVLSAAPALVDCHY